MKILFILNSFYPSIGGVEKVTENYCKELLLMGNEIDLITFRRGQISSFNIISTPDFENYKGICIHRINNRMFGLTLFLKMKSLFKKKKFDLIYSTDFWGIYSIYFKLRYRIIHIHHLHGYQEICPNGLLLCQNFIKRPMKMCYSTCKYKVHKLLFDKLMYWLIWFFSDIILTVSKAVKKAYIRMVPYLKNKIFVLHNGISIINKELNTNITKKSTTKYIINGENVLLFVGRLIKHRNLKIIIQKFPYLQSKISNLKFLIVGDGPELNNLKEEVRKLNLTNRILFTGILTGNDLNYIYANSDLLIMPITFPEPLSTVVIEAMSRGCPSITFNIGGMNEIIDNMVDGFLVKYNDWKSFIEKIVYVFQNKNLLQKIKQNAIMKVQLKFNIKKQAFELNRICNKMIKS
ncbi:MAG: glycosyltransferase family 4 protein [Candidatus Helarchaeota archaeon]